MMAKAKKRSAKKNSRAKAKTRKKGGAKKKRAAAPSLDALARKIVRLTQSPSIDEAAVLALYSPDCTSQEATGNVDRGHAGLEQKNQRWAQMQTGTVWK